MNILKHKTVVVIDQALTGYSARRLREFAQLSLRKVAKEMGISAPFLSDLENGKRNWTRTKAVQFQDAVDRLVKKRKETHE